MSHRASTHESDPDDIGYLYNLKGRPSAGSGGSGPSPWPRPTAPAMTALIFWVLAAVFARFTYTMDSPVDDTYWSDWSSRRDFDFLVGAVIHMTTTVEFLLAIVGALAALALVAAEAGRERTIAAVVSIVLAGLALSVFLNGWIVLLFESSVRQGVWWVGLLMGVCPVIVLAVSIVELRRSAAR